MLTFILNYGNMYLETRTVLEQTHEGGNGMEEIKVKALETKVALRTGLITEAQAVKDIKGYVTAFNNLAKELALKYGQKARCITAKQYLYSNY